MKTTVKIFILLLAVTCAIGGVMVYAKTKVAPPVAIRESDQYIKEVIKLVEEEESTQSAKEEDEVFAKGVDRINIFVQEGKMTLSEADKNLDKFVASYSPRFLKRCFAEFYKSEWSEDAHAYILSQSAILKGVTHADNTPVVSTSTIDSLELAANIITDYRDAKRVSRISKFTGYDKAKSVISTADAYAKHWYLSRCTALLHELNQVKSRLEQSCYNQVYANVEKLSKYRNYSKEYYDNTLVNQVDQVIKNYDNKSKAIFGKKRSVIYLWNRAREYYKEAMEYYEKIEKEQEMNSSQNVF